MRARILCGRPMEVQMPVVLVVDDHVGIAQAVATMVELSGSVAAVVHSGERAIEYLGNHSADLVLLDVSMPGMSGLDVLRVLRGDARRTGLPVVMFSANDEYRDESLRLGADDFLRKDEVDRLPGLIERYAPATGQRVRAHA